MDRAQTRVLMRERRAALSPVAHAEASSAVTATLLGMGLPNTVFAFVSVRQEIDTRPLLAALRARGRVGIPRMTGPGEMVCVAYDGALIPGPFGVPTSEGGILTPALAIVPGLAFDGKGGRLGYGGGFYDRWLAAHPEVITVGIGFGVQLLPEVEMSATDVPLDGVLTERGWAHRGLRLEPFLA